jgi:hypothetical protein
LLLAPQLEKKNNRMALIDFFKKGPVYLEMEFDKIDRWCGLVRDDAPK